MARDPGTGGRPTPRSAKAAAIQAATQAIHSIVDSTPPAPAKKPARKPRPVAPHRGILAVPSSERTPTRRRPSTPIVTEHTHGQAGPVPGQHERIQAAYLRNLPMIHGAENRAYGHPYTLSDNPAALVDKLLGSPVESVHALATHPLRTLFPQPVHTIAGRRGGFDSGQVAPMEDQPINAGQIPYGPVKGLSAFTRAGRAAARAAKTAPADVAAEAVPKTPRPTPTQVDIQGNLRYVPVMVRVDRNNVVQGVDVGRPGDSHLQVPGGAGGNGITAGVQGTVVLDEVNGVMRPIKTNFTQASWERDAGLQAQVRDAVERTFHDPVTESAVTHAQKHGIDIAEVKGTGAAGKVLRGDVERHRVQSLPLAEQVMQATKGARSAYGTKEVARHQELKVRAAAVDKALRTIADPDEAMAAAAAAMRGAHAEIDFHGFKNLTPESMKALKAHVNHLDTLQPFQKITLNKAMTRAFEDNRVPRPHEMLLIDHVFGKQTAMGFAQHAGNWGDKIINVLNIPRSLQSTLDLSAVGRQSLVAGTSHPIIWGRNFPGMLRSMKSGAHYVESLQRLKADPLYPLALAAKVSFTDIGEHTSLGAHEEAFASDYATHIPGLGHAIKGSARAYTGFLNQLRMDLFRHQIRIALKAGTNINDEKWLRDIGQVINAPTGRGTIHGRIEHILPAMNTFLYSPRLMLSRINYLDPTWYVRLGPQARREALRGLFATAGSVTGALYLFSRIPGVNIGSLDPRSADFGKLRAGNTRIDVAAGFQQYIRLASELATQTSVSSTTGQKQKLGAGFGSPTSLDVIQNFVYNKLAPSGNIAVSALRGHDAVGGPVNLPGQGEKTLGVPFGTILPNNFTPLVLQDAKDIYNEKHGGVDGITWALGGYGLGALGEGVQTYSGQKKPTISPYEKKLKYIGEPETPEIKALFTLAAARAANRSGEKKTVHGRLVADLKTLREAGKIDAQAEAETLAQANGMSEYALAQALSKAGFNKHFDPTGALSRLDRAALKKQRGG